MPEDEVQDLLGDTELDMSDEEEVTDPITGEPVPRKPVTGDDDEETEEEDEVL